MNESNTTHSPFYQYAKFYRKEFEELKKIKIHSQYKSYAYMFLLLLSHAVCENVDIKNAVDLKGNKPNMYIEEMELIKLLNCENKAALNVVLNALKERFNAVDYAVLTVSKDGKKRRLYYFYFKICNQYIEKGDYSKTNNNHFNNIQAINNDNGFVFADKTELFDTFYKNNTLSSGIEDLYILLRLNIVYKSNNLSACVPFTLRDYHIAIWKTQDSDSELEYSLYCRRNDMSGFLGISEKTISRYFKILKECGFIGYSYLHKRGTVVIFTYIDNIDSENKEQNTEKSTIEKVIKFVSNCVKMFIKQYSINIYNIYRKGYTFFKHRLLYLNVRAKPVSSASS